MRISDWSSDVCSSDLSCKPSGSSPGAISVIVVGLHLRHPGLRRDDGESQNRSAFAWRTPGSATIFFSSSLPIGESTDSRSTDRTRVVRGKRVSGRVVLGGRRSIKKKQQTSRKI